MTNPQLRGTPFNVNAIGTSTAQAVTTNGTNVTFYVTDISAGSSVNSVGTWTVLWSSSTVLWAGAGVVNATFSTPIRALGTGTISFLVNGTTNTYASMSGFSYP